jgi:hypothetical protein
MLPYRIEFFDETGRVFAMHEIDYGDDRAAIAGGHEINGSPTIGAGFRIWQGGRLVHHHSNEPEISD